MRNRNPERLIFEQDRDNTAHLSYVKDARGWALFGPFDVRNDGPTYRFMLQKLPHQKLPRVRVGCRYFTLQQAWKHWGVRRRGDPRSRRNHCAQAVAIIRLMLLQAQACRLLSMYRDPVKFDSTILKPKRK